MSEESKTRAARAFVRSLNILLKSVRLYGFDHHRTLAQFDTAWEELHAALPSEGEAGLLLGISGSQLLIDGVPIETTPAERSFANMLSTAGLASIDFSPHLTRKDFASLVRTFAAGAAKPTGLAEQLKAALGDSRQAPIRVNVVRFVAEDAGFGEARAAAQLTARTLGADTEKVQEWFNDPQKLLQLIAAAEGAQTEPGSAPAGAPPTPVQPGSSPVAAPGDVAETPPPQEQDLLGIIRVLSQLSESSRQAGAAPEPGQIQQHLAELPTTAQVTLQQALAGLAAATPAEEPDKPMLLRLAEHLAIRFALDRYERGKVRVNAVRELLDRMNREIETLRQVLGTHEDKMARAGLLVESHADILDRQFWAAVPEATKLSVLLSLQAWCIPARNIRQFIEQLLERGEAEKARSILLNYALCIHTPDLEARQRTAMGLSELVELYARAEVGLLDAAVLHAAQQLELESAPEMQGLLNATFTRLSQKAASGRDYPAIEQVLARLERVERAQHALAKDLRSRIGLENRLPEFIEEALAAPEVPNELMKVLRHLPGAAAAQLALRFQRCSNRAERDRLVELLQGLGPEGTNHLREMLGARPAAQAAYAVGLLSRLDFAALAEFLPQQVRGWTRFYHNVVVHQLACGEAPERGRLLANLLSVLHARVLPSAVDEIGISGDPTTASELIRRAEAQPPLAASPLVRVKAIEALGRLRDSSAAPFLRRLVEAKQLWRWQQPHELRIVAVQALLHIDPPWAQNFLPGSGLTAEELAQGPIDPDPNAPWVRERRYPRVSLLDAQQAVASTPRGSSRLKIKLLSLGGVLATSDHPFPVGTEARVEIRSGFRPLHAEVLVREVHRWEVGFEFVEISLENRSKLRRLLAAAGARAA